MRNAKGYTTALAVIGVMWGSLWYWPQHHIYDRTAFRIVVIISLIQAIVVLLGGKLAIAALPQEELYGYKRGRTTKRKFYTHWFNFFACLLFICTCYLGYLNDQSQADAKQRNDRLNGQLSQTNGKLENANDTLAAISRCQQTPNCTKENIAVILATRTEKHPSISSSTATTQLSQPSTNVSDVQPFSVPQSVLTEETNLFTAVGSLIGELKAADDVSTRDASLKVHYYAFKPNERKDALDKIELKRDTEYQRILPHIEKVHFATQNQLKMSPQQTEIDTQKFEQLISAASKSPEIGGAQIARFGDLEAYLTNLKDQLWSRMRGTTN